MKILALNSSPRKGEESKTALMLAHLVDGMRQADAEVDVIELHKKNIKNCIGCFTCWTKTPGKCIHKDDMTVELMPKWQAADLVVYATPLYHYTMNATMKAFIERTLPVLEPFFEKHDNGGTAHPYRQKPPNAVVLSVAGFPELSVFDQLSNYVNFLFGRGDRLLAEIYRPAAETLPLVKSKNGDIFAATVQAGRELVTSKRIAVETLEKIQQPIIDFPTFAATGNAYWKTCIAEGVTPKTFREKHMRPRPDSIEAFMAILAMGFNREAGKDTRATLQFDFSGKVEGACHFMIDCGNIEVVAGKTDSPDLTIATPFEIWMDVMTGKADGQKMFMEQKYQVTGDLELLMRFGELFGS